MTGSSSSNAYANFTRESAAEEPRALQLIRWAFANPEKIAAMGLGIAVFGFTAFFLGNYKQDRLAKASSGTDGLERTS